MKLKGPVVVLLLILAVGAAGASAYFTFFRKDTPNLTPEQRQAAEKAISAFRKK